MDRSDDDHDEGGRNSNLEIKVISAKHLWSFNFFQKLCIYAVASLCGAADSTLQLSKDQMQEQRTPTDPNGDGHPEWNHPMSFRLLHLPSPSDLFLHLDLRHHAGLLFPDRTIGEVRVPLSDLLQSPAALRFVDYQVRSPDGKPNGSLRFSYLLNRAPDHDQPPAGDPPLAISGYPQISDRPEGASALYPALDPWDTPAPQDHEAPPETHTPAAPALMPQYPHVQMWPPPPPPPPPQYWAPPPGFMYRPPPPPPPGYLNHPWNYHHTTASQHNTGW